jgi:DNA-binding transcriptional regulator YiaG
MKKEKRQITIYNNRYQQAKKDGAKKIKFFRLFHMISEQELAKKFGVCQQAVSQWESKYCPSQKYIKMYAQEAAKRKYKLSADDIINDY